MPLAYGRVIELREAAWVCDECGKGQMVYTRADFVDENNIKTFEHECPECKEIVYLNRIYPALADSPVKVYAADLQVNGKKKKVNKSRRRKQKKQKGK